MRHGLNQLHDFQLLFQFSKYFSLCRQFLILVQTVSDVFCTLCKYQAQFMLQDANLSANSMEKPKDLLMFIY